MRTPPPRFPLRSATPHPWAPLTDAEWSRLEPLLRRASRGRPPANLRRTWDAIFWVACSRTPWRLLPPELGRADTAHRALRRFARAGFLLRLLIEVTDHPHGGPWEAMRWRICRACRRVSKLVPLGLVLLAERLGLRDALPCEPHQLPQPRLSEIAIPAFRLLRWMHRLPPLVPWLRTLLRTMRGEPRAWRLTA
jgi:transposase